VKHVGTALMTALSRYSLGVTPTISLNVLLNVPRLVKPTSRQISVMLRAVSHSMNIERSTRRRCRYRCGVSPNVDLKVRMK
jgi:hypothetical protein